MPRPARPAMTPQEVVALLYRHLLQREPDPAGLASWSTVIADSGDPTTAIRGIVESEEYALRNPPRSPALDRIAAQAHQALGRRPRIVDVGAQTLGQGTHVYDALMRFCPVEITGFEPLADQIEKRLAAEPDQDVVLLPYAIGDGTRQTLHVNSNDATSSLYPLDPAVTARFRDLCMLRTVRTVAIETRTLDSVLPERQVDLLKLDIQGAELMALTGAARVLRDTACIHCEVEFEAIYRGQPLFPEVAAFLRTHGFHFVDFPTCSRYACVNGRGVASPDRLLWADAVFFRSDDRPEIRAAQALVAAVMYGKPSLAAQLLDG